MVLTHGAGGGERSFRNSTLKFLPRIVQVFF
jgi:hypothetical protein